MMKALSETENIIMDSEINVLKMFVLKVKQKLKKDSLKL